MFSNVSSNLISPVRENSHQLPYEQNEKVAVEECVQACPLAAASDARVSVLTAEGSISRDLLQLIFRHLPPEDVLRACQVCRKWNQIGSKDSLWYSFLIEQLFPEAPIIDGSTWKQYVDVEGYELDVELKGRPVVSKTDYLILKRMEAAVEDGEGFAIMLRPKGLGLNRMIRIAAAPQGDPAIGNRFEFSWVSSYIEEHVGDIEQQETDVVAITRGNFKESRTVLVEPRKKIAHDLGCEVFDPRSATAVAGMTYITSAEGEEPTRLFSDDNHEWTAWTLMIDKEIDKQTGEESEVIAHLGDFSLYGPRIGDEYADGYPGVGGFRKFKVIQS